MNQDTNKENLGYKLIYQTLKKDKPEIRKLYYEAKRKQKDKPDCPRLVTKQEYDKLKKLGINMKNYEPLEDFLKRARKFKY
jgi:hypothetical protein